ncbi:MAG: nickel pincer cofactor biosynthesis protein LarB, partial [Roseovarius sp.]
MSITKTGPDGHPDVTFDRGRGGRIGIEEAVLCEHKSVAQIAAIIGDAAAEERRLLLTRLTAEQFAALPADAAQRVDYCTASRTAILGEIGSLASTPRIALVSAGTSDYAPMAEARRTLAYGGMAATEVSDVGVAGLWRLLAREELLREMVVVIVFAGM